MASNLISDSCGQTPAKSVDRKAQTTRFYGVSFLKGKMIDQDLQPYYDGNNTCDGKNVFFDTYGVCLCTLLIVSIMAVTLGMSLALAGHFTPKKSLISPAKGNHTLAQKIHIVLRYNHMLESFVLSGMVLLALGIILFIFLMVVPFCSAYEVTLKNNEGYELAPNTDAADRMLLDKMASTNQESVVMGMTHDAPAGHFATMHQQLKPADGATLCDR